MSARVAACNRAHLGAALLVAALAWTANLLPAAAAELPTSGTSGRPAAADNGKPQDTSWLPSPSIATSLPSNGDPNGARKWLYDRGFTYSFVYTGETLSNLSGGLRRGSVYQGKLETIVTADLEKLMGWKGLSFYANTFEIHNTGGIGRNLVGGFNTISNIEALPTMRLSELWLEQKFLHDKASIRVGQLAADGEFFVSKFSEPFMTSDWPAVTAVNLPNHGPAYPLSTPGVRLRFEPSKEWSLLGAVFNGDPTGPGPAPAEVKNRYGLNFRVNDPPLLMGEVQYKYNQEKTATGLAGILRLGAWSHFGRFDDQRFGTDGLSLASPMSNGVARLLRGNGGIYGVIDQQIYRPAGGDADSGISVYSRISANPSDRNLINFYLDGGVLFSGMVASRPDDKFGASFIYSRISDRARDLDRDSILLTGMPQPIRDYELSLEFAYIAQIIPGWTVQPEFQYVMHPGGNVPNPDGSAPASAIKNAAVFAVRTVVKY